MVTFKNKTFKNKAPTTRHPLNLSQKGNHHHNPTTITNLL